MLKGETNISIAWISTLPIFYIISPLRKNVITFVLNCFMHCCLIFQALTAGDLVVSTSEVNVRLEYPLTALHFRIFVAEYYSKPALRLSLMGCMRPNVSLDFGETINFFQLQSNLIHHIYSGQSPQILRSSISKIQTYLIYFNLSSLCSGQKSCVELQLYLQGK